MLKSAGRDLVLFCRNDSIIRQQLLTGTLPIQMLFVLGLVVIFLSKTAALL